MEDIFNKIAQITKPQKTEKMKNLSKYYGIDLNYIDTSLNTNGDINTKITIKKSIDLNDFKIMVKPGEGCHFVIGGYSVNKNDIFEINKGINNDTSFFALKRYNTINLFTYCTDKNINKVKKLHLSIIKKSILDLKIELNNTIKHLKTININTK